jgi:hypothetical protein
VPAAKGQSPALVTEDARSFNAKLRGGIALPA